MKRAAAVMLAAVLFALWAAALLLPLPARAGEEAETYLCLWEDGTTKESYAAAYAALAGAQPDGVVLERDGKRGVIRAGEAYRALLAVLETGDLPALLSADGAGLTRIERAAVWRTYSARLWYADEWFSWTGDAIARTARSEHVSAQTLTVFSGFPAARDLAALGVERLVLREAYPVSAVDFIGTRVCALEIPAPYSVQDGAVLLATAGGVRIVCALPTVRTLALPDADYADEGALLACGGLEEVRVPFVGSALRAEGTAFTGRFSHLFSDGEDVYVPSSLQRVTIAGGTLAAFAFYGCPDVEYVDCCTVAAENISRTAFSGMAGLAELHCPRADLVMTGSFSRERLACGCTRYVRDA